MKSSITTGLRAVLLCLPVMATAPLAAAADKEQIIDCMRANIPRSVQIKEVEMTATDRTGGTRQLRGRLYGTREEDKLLRTMIKINAPSDLAGAAYLLRERASGGDEMYMFVPALQRVRRISGAGADGALWGTDFSYGDVKQINNAFSGGKTELLAPGELGGRPVHRLELTPDAAEGSRFSLIRISVDQKSCVSLQAEFLEGGNVRKRWEVDPASLQQSGAHWYAGDGTMRDLKENTHTRLRVIGLSSDVDLSGRYFNPKIFYVGS